MAVVRSSSSPLRDTPAVESASRGRVDLVIPTRQPDCCEPPHTLVDRSGGHAAMADAHAESGILSPNLRG